MGVVRLIAQSDVPSAIVPAVLALAGEPRLAGTMTTDSPGTGVAAGLAGSPDTVSQAWVARLGCPGAERDAAAAELHGVLLRAARFEIRRRQAAFPDLAGADLDDLAWQSADDALMSILRRLGDFRGEQPVHHLGLQIRRRRGGRQGPQARLARPRDPPHPGVLAGPGRPIGPHQHAEARDLLEALREEIGRLTPRQRQVFAAIALSDVPIDVLADRLNTTRGALYKTLHDARRHLKAALAARGWAAPQSGGDRDHAR
jgi:RNA polymerase sigma-70 factor, ECF subfamily